MNNRILHLISNRTGPFLEALFGSDSSFVPSVVPAAEIAFRQQMFLDRTETDYYLKIYLAVLNAYPDWKQQFGEALQESYRPEDLMPKGVYISGGDLLSFAGDPGVFIDPPLNALPVELKYHISYVRNDLCNIAGLE